MTLQPLPLRWWLVLVVVASRGSCACCAFQTTVRIHEAAVRAKTARRRTATQLERTTTTTVPWAAATRLPLAQRSSEDITAAAAAAPRTPPSVGRSKKKRPERAEKSVLPKSSSTTAAAAALAAASEQCLLVELQRCHTASDILHCVDQFHDSIPGKVASLILVRLSKYCLHWYNQQLVSLSQLDQQEGSLYTGDEKAWLASVKNHGGNSSWWTCSPGQNAKKVLQVEQIFDRLFQSVDHAIVWPMYWDSDLHRTNDDVLRAWLDAMVEATKAVAILMRVQLDAGRYIDWVVHPDMVRQEYIWDSWEYTITQTTLDETHIVGLAWAYNSIHIDSKLPGWLEAAYTNVSVPFRIVPYALRGALGGTLSDYSDPSRLVATLRNEVKFAVDEICAIANATAATAKAAVVKVPERRWTAWQGDYNVGPFEYSGKSMPRQDWSPTVQIIRNALAARGSPPQGSLSASSQYYNACLLNLYPDGASGMRYHCDPDQGTKWDYDTAVVSLGAARRFAIRPIPLHNQTRALSSQRSNRPHSLVVFHSDITYMWGDCQGRFQHAVKNADFQQVSSPRISLVFKRTWNYTMPEH
jgi:alkylated DNA repair dioxygenase AlkB